MNDNQKIVFDSYLNTNKHLILSGCAGTGKTFLALYLALKDILTGRNQFDSIIITRSLVQTRDIGFLPGTVGEKLASYEEPYQHICNFLLERDDGYSILKQKGLIKFVTTSFLRGITWENSLIIVDEMQNCSFHELDTLITRIGQNTRLILSGDVEQTDLNKIDAEPFFRIIDSMDEYFINVNFGIDDIVRSGLVKEYLKRKWLSGTLK